MNTNKFIIGGIIGGIANFILGWLVWGMLLMNFMKDHTSEAGKAAMRADKDTIWWAVVAGSLFFGLTLSYVLSKSGAKSAGSGVTTGAVLCLLISLFTNFFNYAFMNMGDTTGMIVDVAASLVVGGITGGIIGWYFGMGKKAAAA